MDAAVVAPVPVWSSPCGAAAAAAGAAGVAAGATAAPTPTATPNTASRPTPNPASRRAVFIADSSWVAWPPRGAVSYRDAERRNAAAPTVKVPVQADGCGAATDRGDERGSGADQSGDGLRGLPDLLVGLGSSGGGGLHHAVTQVLVQQPERHRLQRLGHRRDLGQDVDAVLLVLHHLLQATGLTLDAAQPLQVVVLAVDVPVRVRLLVGPGNHVALHSFSGPSFPEPRLNTPRWYCSIVMVAYPPR